MEWYPKNIFKEDIYVKRPDGDKTQEAAQRQYYNLPRISGLMRPFPDQTSAALYQGLTINDVNSDAYRQQIIANCESRFSFS